MEAKELLKIYSAHPGVDALVNLRNESGKKSVLIDGLTGSSVALVISGLKERLPRQTFMIIMNKRTMSTEF